MSGRSLRSESRSTLAMTGLDIDELAQSLIPVLTKCIQESIQETISKNISDQFEKVNTCITSNLENINEKLCAIGSRYEKIESELETIGQSVSNLKLSQDCTNDRISTLEAALEHSKADLSKVESNCETLAAEKKKITAELEILKKQLETNKSPEFLKEKVDQLLKETIAPEREERDRDQCEPEWQVLTECRLESIEQYNRRDCLLFFGLEERDEEDCTDVIVNTSRAMGIAIYHDDISISHRLHTKSRRPNEPRPIIVKFTRRSTRNYIFASKHHLKHSQYHYNVFIREQLTKESQSCLSS